MSYIMFVIVKLMKLWKMSIVYTEHRKWCPFMLINMMYTNNNMDEKILYKKWFIEDKIYFITYK